MNEKVMSSSKKLLETLLEGRKSMDFMKAATYFMKEELSVEEIFEKILGLGPIKLAEFFAEYEEVEFVYNGAVYLYPENTIPDTVYVVRQTQPSSNYYQYAFLAYLNRQDAVSTVGDLNAQYLDGEDHYYELDSIDLVR